MDIIKTGSTWVLRTAPILDITGVRLTGLTDIKFSVSRYTGGAWQWLDTADMTFRASPAGYQFTMTAVDATKVAGVYHYVIDWTTVTNVAFGDQLFFDVQQVTLTNASNPNQSSETAYGSIVDKVEANLTVATSTLATPTNITAGVITTVTNVTNAPTNGDLTAAMKASVTTAATAATPTAAAVTGSVGSVAANGITSTSIAADAINAAAVKADAVTKIQTGLATSTNVSDATTAINTHTDSATSGLAQQGTLTAGVVAILADVDSVPAATSAAVTSAHGAGSYVAISAVAISSQVASDLASAHGAGSWATASVAGLATGQNVLDAVTAIEAYGAIHWITATGFATSTNVSDSTAALTATIGAVPAAVWSTPEGSPAVGTFGFGQLLMREFITNKQSLTPGAPGVIRLYKDDGVTVRITWNATASGGGPILAVVGAPFNRAAGTVTP